MDSEARPLTSLQSVTLSTGPFGFLWGLARQYVTQKGAFAVAKPVLILNYRLEAIFSLILAYFLLRDTFYFKDRMQIDYDTADLAYIYHCFQIYQYLEVLLLVASGGVVSSYTAFTHITMPYLTYFRVLNASNWQVFAVLNCIHNFLTYTCAGGAGSLKPLLPVTGCLQLLLPVALDVYWLSQSGTGAQESNSRMIAVLLWVRYGFMFGEEMRNKNKVKNKQN